MKYRILNAQFITVIALAISTGLIAPAAAQDEVKDAVAMDNLGLKYTRMGKYQQAKDLHNKAIEIWQRKAPNSFDLAISMADLASAYAYEGNLAEAEGILKKAVSIGELAKPSSEAKLKILWGNYAQVLWKVGKRTEAKKFFTKAGESPPAHEDASKASKEWQETERLGVAAVEQKNYAEAEKLFSQNVMLAEKEKNLICIASSSARLGNLYFELEKYQKSEAYLQKALDAARKTYGNSDNLVGYLAPLAMTLAFEGKFADAEKLNAQAIGQAEKNSRMNTLASVLQNQGLIYLMQQKIAQSDGPIVRAIAVLEKDSAVNESNIGELYLLRATVLSCQGKDSEAIPYVKKAFGPGADSISDLEWLDELRKLRERLRQHNWNFLKAMRSLN